ncbi:MAG: bifunctional 4-hydroxy-2-oxoglutarate aldolase/2-dehydro-3-deoxy-phosphogluconate aldolase [Marinifilaceae bacterium]
MARFTRIEVALTMKKIGVVPVFYHQDINVCKNVIRACYNGGARVFEFTNRGDFAHELFAELIKWSAQELPELILGIGSVIDAGTAALYLQLGANFIVSPLLNADMAKVCNRRKVLWAPGCGTLSEMNYAEELGAEIVKLFPGTGVGGASFVAAIKGPCPWSSIMPTGGVSPTRESLTTWFHAGVTCVGIGSQLFSKEQIVGEKWSEITSLMEQTITLIEEIRNEM